MPELAVSRRWVLSGHVQGVGFRPFVYRLAKKYELTGWVRNRVGIVEIQAQGAKESLREFGHHIVDQAPPLAQPRVKMCTVVPNNNSIDFTILDSVSDGDVEVQVPADLFLCDDCLREMRDPENRRYRYPFINCTQCGPRYTLIRAMPYDRPNTSMAAFELCNQCRTEYEDPYNRRFHAEPIACADCGPVLEYRSAQGETTTGNDAALTVCLETLNASGIVAIKGIGGYHLMCDARNDSTVRRLRALKPRPDKPLAVMFPSAQLADSVALSREQIRLLCSPARPIVLARKLRNDGLAPSVAPQLNEIGVMLPNSPLHHLLLDDFGWPLIATSANISGEPVLSEAQEVEMRLAHVVDGCLHHDRPIERPADDSVFRVIRAKNRPIRLGRGSAPLELELPFSLQRPVLALGGHMKNTIALAWANRVVVSPHIGDLGSTRSVDILLNIIKDMKNLYKVNPEFVICDAHPGYATTRQAQEMGLPVEKIWHHHAHASAAVGCNAGPKPWLAFTWDGVGYGEDGTLWGGEALLGRPGAWRRIATMRSFRLPGGERAGREPWRSAAALCWELGIECPVAPEDASLLHSAWQRQINSPQTTAVGRIFDAAAALTGVCDKASFEGQGPMLLEAVCEKAGEPIELPLTCNREGVWSSDWEPLVTKLLDSSRTQSNRAAMLHASLAKVVVDQAKQVREEQGVEQIVLSGGVFQNRVLTESTMAGLEREGFSVTFPEQIPVNDAGLSFGQIIEFGYKEL